jgi:uncharacterized membrane protein
MSDPIDPSDPSRPRSGADRPDAAPGGAPPPPDYSAASDGPNPDEAQLRGDYRSRGEQFRAGAEDAATKMRGAAEKAQEHTRVHMDSARATVAESDARTIAIAAYALNLGVWVTLGASAVVAVVLAWVKRDSADPETASHLRFQIRTFWIGLAAFILGLVLTTIFIGVLVLIALAVWWTLRNVIGLIRLIERRPMRDPQAWLV